MTTHAQPTRHPGRRTRRLLGLAAAISMTAVLAACSSSDGGLDASEDSAGSADESSSASRDPGGDGGGSGGTAGSGSDGAAARERGSGATTSSTGAARAPVAVERHVISHGTVSLTSDDVREARRDVQRVVDASGGDITEEQTDTDEDGESVYARLVVRVPAGSFGDAMTALEGVGDLRGSDRTSEDVSTQVIDTDVRVRAQEASLQRVEQLLARAQGLKDIIWIESQLTTRQAELDSLKGQLAWLEDQTSLSTITVYLEPTPEKPEPSATKKDDDTAFVSGLRSGWDALTDVGAGLATVAGALLPFALVGLLLGVPAALVARRWLVRHPLRRPTAEV
jgi:hypothetical protein